MNINYQSDFKIIERLMPDAPFRFTYYAAKDKGSVTAEYDGQSYSGCFVDGERLIVPVDGGTLGIGNVRVKREYFLDDKAFADGVCNLVSVEGTDIELGRGRTDSDIEADVEVGVYYKAFTFDDMTEEQKQEIADRVPTKEGEREKAEAQRVEAEKGRVEAEAARKATFDTNEAARQATFNTNESEREAEFNAAIQSAKDNLIVVNDLTTGGADKALSAEMGKELNNRTIPLGMSTPFFQISARILNGNFVRNDGSTALIVDVSSFSQVQLKKGENNSFFAFLTDYSDNDTVPQFCSDYSGAGVQMASVTVNVPSDAKYLYVLTNVGGTSDRTPRMIRLDNVYDLLKYVPNYLINAANDIKRLSLGAVSYRTIDARITAGSYVRDDGSTALIINAEGHKTVSFIPPTNTNSFFAFLTDYSDNDTVPQFCSDYSGAGVQMASVTVNVPSDAKYLYVLTNVGGTSDRTPRQVALDGVAYDATPYVKALGAINSPASPIDLSGNGMAASAYVKEIYIGGSYFSPSHNIALESYGIVSSGNFQAHFFIDTNEAFSLDLDKRLVPLGEQLVPLKNRGCIAGYAVVDASSLPAVARNQKIKLTSSCFDLEAMPKIKARVTSLLEVLDLSQLTEMNLDFVSIAESETRAIVIRPTLSIPYRGDAILIASDIEDYDTRSNPTDSELVRAFAPYLYFKMKKIGTFVLYDETTGNPYIYKADGTKIYLATI